MSHEETSKLDALTAMVQNDPLYLIGRIWRIVRDEAVAEDISQEVMVRAIRGLDGFRGEARDTQLCPWLERIARNLALNHIRDQGRRPYQHSLDAAGEPLAEQLAREENDPAILSSRAETHAYLVQLIQALSPEIRTVFLLRELENLSTAATAAAVGISEDLVKWRLQRARKQLRQRLLEGEHLRAS